MNEMLKQLEEFKKQSNCPKRQVTAFICAKENTVYKTKDGNIIDLPKILVRAANTIDEEYAHICKTCNKVSCMAIHAEVKALSTISMKMYMAPLDNKFVMYTSRIPCLPCLKTIIQSGIIETLFYYGPSDKEEVIRVAKEQNFDLRSLENENNSSKDNN